MTKAIDKTGGLPENIWLQRGVNSLNTPLGDVYGMSEFDLKN